MIYPPNQGPRSKDQKSRIIASRNQESRTKEPRTKSQGARDKNIYTKNIYIYIYNHIYISGACMGHCTIFVVRCNSMCIELVPKNLKTI